MVRGNSRISMGSGKWFESLEVYSDRTNVFYKIESPPCKFVFKGGELVSYGWELSDKFYVKHFQKDLKGRVVEGEEYSIRESGAEWEIEVRKGDFSLMFDYIPLGKRLALFIKVEARKWSCVILPEFNRIYQGKIVKLKSVSGGIQVLEQYENGLVDDVRAYILMPDGKEYLIYEGGEYAYPPYELYKLRGADVWIFEFKKGRIEERYKEYWLEGFKKYFIKAPDLNYLFIRSYYDSSGGVVEFSFDMDKWINVGAGRLIFRYEPGLESKGKYTPFEYCAYVSEETLRVIKRKIQTILEDIKANQYNEGLEISALGG